MRDRYKVKYFIAILLCFLLNVCIFAGCGAQDSVILIPEDKVSEDGILQSDSGESGLENEIPKAFVYVCGAVVRPQVVEIPEGSRIQDALEAAGGFSENAHKEYVNLAEKVKDGQKLYFPTMEEVILWEEEAQNKKQGLVDINTAGLEELMTLPGIGESRAKDILSYREANGAFEQIEDLQKVPGIKENMYAKLCDKIVVR